MSISYPIKYSCFSKSFKKKNASCELQLNKKFWRVIVEAYDWFHSSTYQ